MDGRKSILLNELSSKISGTVVYFDVVYDGDFVILGDNLTKPINVKYDHVSLGYIADFVKGLSPMSFDEFYNEYCDLLTIKDEPESVIKFELLPGLSVRQGILPLLKDNEKYREELVSFANKFSEEFKQKYSIENGYLVSKQAKYFLVKESEDLNVFNMVFDTIYGVTYQEISPLSSFDFTDFERNFDIHMEIGNSLKEEQKSLSIDPVHGLEDVYQQLSSRVNLKDQQALYVSNKEDFKGFTLNSVTKIGNDRLNLRTTLKGVLPVEFLFTQDKDNLKIEAIIDAFVNGKKVTLGPMVVPGGLSVGIYIIKYLNNVLSMISSGFSNHSVCLYTGKENGYVFLTVDSPYDLTDKFLFGFIDEDNSKLNKTVVTVIDHTGKRVGTTTVNGNINKVSRDDYINGFHFSVKDYTDLTRLTREKRLNIYLQRVFTFVAPFTSPITVVSVTDAEPRYMYIKYTNNMTGGYDVVKMKFTSERFYDKLTTLAKNEWQHYGDRRLKEIYHFVKEELSSLPDYRVEWDDLPSTPLRLIGTTENVNDDISITGTVSGNGQVHLTAMIDNGNIILSSVSDLLTKYDAGFRYVESVSNVRLVDDFVKQFTKYIDQAKTGYIVDVIEDVYDSHKQNQSITYRVGKYIVEVFTKFNEYLVIMTTNTDTDDVVKRTYVKDNFIDNLEVVKLIKNHLNIELIEKEFDNPFM